MSGRHTGAGLGWAYLGGVHGGGVGWAPRLLGVYDVVAGACDMVWALKVAPAVVFVVVFVIRVLMLRHPASNACFTACRPLVD